MQLAMHGHTDVSIATQLDISEATVSTYWGRIRIKLGPYSRTELVAIYLQHENSKTLEQLKSENERLAKQVAERGHDVWQDIIENAPDAILVISESGIIETANEQAARLFGYEGAELAGKPVSMLIPERHRQAHDVHRASYLAHPERRKMGAHLSTHALRKDGSELLIAATLNVTNSEQGPLVTCIAREVDPPRILEREQA